MLTCSPVCRPGGELRGVMIVRLLLALDAYDFVRARDGVSRISAGWWLREVAWIPPCSSSDTLATAGSGASPHSSETSEVRHLILIPAIVGLDVLQRVDGLCGVLDADAAWADRQQTNQHRGRARSHSLPPASRVLGRTSAGAL